MFASIYDEHSHGVKLAQYGGSDLIYLDCFIFALVSIGTKSGVEYAAGSWSHKGFAIVGNGKIAITTPSYKFAKWYADKFECRAIWALNPENLRDMLCDARSPVRIVMEWDFDAMCEIEKGNPGQSIELIDMKTGLTAIVDSVERLLDNAYCGDVAQQNGA